MKGNKIGLWAMFGTILLIMLLSTAQAQQPGDAGFAVRPIFPENQVDPSVGYYYLNPEPGQAQTLEVIVMNRGGEDIRVQLEANTAFSNSNGIIEYTFSGEKDPSLEIDFATHVTIPEPILIVPAKGEVKATFILEMPEEELAGEMLGGLIVKKLPPELSEEEAMRQQSEGLAIANVFVYAIAVRIRQSDVDIAPTFEVSAARLGELAGYQTLQLDIRNPQPAIVKGLTLDVQVFSDESGEEVLAFIHEKRSMAPNSLMAFQHVFYEGEALAPGEYRIEVKLIYRESTWAFSLPLTVIGS